MHRIKSLRLGGETSYRTNADQPTANGSRRSVSDDDDVRLRISADGFFCPQEKNIVGPLVASFLGNQLLLEPGNHVAAASSLDEGIGSRTSSRRMTNEECTAMMPPLLEEDGLVDWIQHSNMDVIDLTEFLSSSSSHRRSSSTFRSWRKSRDDRHQLERFRKLRDFESSCGDHLYELDENENESNKNSASSQRRARSRGNHSPHRGIRDSHRMSNAVLKPRSRTGNSHNHTAAVQNIKMSKTVGLRNLERPGRCRRPSVDKENT
jgi:hypothetical protein